MSISNDNLVVNYDQYVPEFITNISEDHGAYALREAWKRVYGSFPNNRQLALLWAQASLETGRFKLMKNNNFGNIKKKHYQKLSWTEIPDDGHDWTMFATGENLWNKELQKMEWHWFEPPHFQTHFRSYGTMIDGAEDYIRLISEKKRYVKAWAEIMNGDPKAYSMELYKAGYYTANPEKYTAGIVRLFNEFLKREGEFLAFVPESEESRKSMTKLEIQKNKEILMDEIKILGYISPAQSTDTTEEVIEAEVVEAKTAMVEVKSGVKNSLIMLVAAGLATIYAWFAGFFN